VLVVLKLKKVLVLPFTCHSHLLSEINSWNKSNDDSFLLNYFQNDVFENSELN